MAINNRYYTDVNFLNVVYAVDYAVIHHFANLLFDGDDTRVIYSSNANAFRKRADNNEGNLNLPFINFYMSNYMPGDRLKWNSPVYGRGIFVPEIEEKIRYAPITLDYEASFWCHTNYDLNYAFSEYGWDADNKTTLKPSVIVKEQEIPFASHLAYDGLDFQPEYNEQDWLERNKIQSASLDFQMETFALKVNADVSIPEKILFNFVKSQGGDVGTVTEAYEFLMSELE